jgi:hypothetical protein
MNPLRVGDKLQMTNVNTIFNSLQSRPCFILELLTHDHYMKYNYPLS